MAKLELHLRCIFGSGASVASKNPSFPTFGSALTLRSGFLRQRNFEHRRLRPHQREDSRHLSAIFVRHAYTPRLLQCSRSVQSGCGGFGKSSLLARMIHECALRKLRKSEITWTETQNHDYLGIMRKVRDDVGVEYFQNFTNLVNELTDPSIRITVAANISSIQVGQGLRAQGSTVGDLGGVIVKDNMFVVPKGDHSIPESERMIPLTTAFLQNLAAVARAIGPVVVFFDAVEKMTRETSAWVVGELFRAVQTGTLKNVFLVHCGREKPVIDRFMDIIVEQAELGPLERGDVLLYLQKRGIEEPNLDPYAELLLVATKGNPLQIATLIDAVMKERKKKN